MFKEQHGFIGHMLGGWGVSANYVLASGQRYTPSQVFISEFSANDYFDAGFYNSVQWRRRACSSIHREPQRSRNQRRHFRWGCLPSICKHGN